MDTTLKFLVIILTLMQLANIIFHIWYRNKMRTLFHEMRAEIVRITNIIRKHNLKG